VGMCHASSHERPGHSTAQSKQRNHHTRNTTHGWLRRVIRKYRSFAFSLRPGCCSPPPQPAQALLHVLAPFLIWVLETVFPGCSADALCVGEPPLAPESTVAPALQPLAAALRPYLHLQPDAPAPPESPGPATGEASATATTVVGTQAVPRPNTNAAEGVAVALDEHLGTSAAGSTRRPAAVDETAGPPTSPCQATDTGAVPLAPPSGQGDVAAASSAPLAAPAVKPAALAAQPLAAPAPLPLSPRRLGDVAPTDAASSPTVLGTSPSRPPQPPQPLPSPPPPPVPSPLGDSLVAASPRRVSAATPTPAPSTPIVSPAPPAPPAPAAAVSPTLLPRPAPSPALAPMPTPVVFAGAPLASPALEPAIGLRSVAVLPPVAGAGAATLGPATPALQLAPPPSPEQR